MSEGEAGRRGGSREWPRGEAVAPEERRPAAGAAVPSVARRRDARDRGAESASDRARRVGERFIRGLLHHDLFGLGAEMAYRFLFSLFPFLLFVAALAAFVAGAMHIEDPVRRVTSALGDNLPVAVAAAIRTQVQHLIASPRADLLSVGAIAALWAATGGTNALVKGMHRAYEVPEYRPLLLRYVVAVGLTLLAAVGMVGSFVVIVGGTLATQQLATTLGIGTGVWAAAQVLRWPAVLVLLTAAVAVLYRFAPNVVVPWRWILVGSLAFALGWLLATAGFAYYAANVADYGATYGSLGGVIVLMLWLYLTGVLLLLGAELTAALARELTPGAIHRLRSEEAAARAVDEAMEDAERTAHREIDSIEDAWRT